MSASDLCADDFAAFFRAVYGVGPFPWQQHLLERVATDGAWPDVLDLPTGAGKTAAIDIAVFHLALAASRGEQRSALVRIAFVVDRRLIVDDAYARARTLAKVLATSDKPIVMRVAAALRRLAGEGQRPLLVRRLRGGMPREDDWARTPVQPTVLCSTVDQVGSRLLFRGYGVSDRMKPVHAGLLGSDCLILLDEAHISQPFRQTLGAVRRLRRPDEAPWGATLLTATPDQQAERSFLSEEDRAHPLLSHRLKASKPVRLVEIAGRQGVNAEARRVEALADEAKASLEELRRSGIACPAIGVVVNRVLRARAVFERLRIELSDCEVTLIIGPARTIDRETRADKLAPIRTGAPRTLEKPLLVVATQTIEVGVDIDLDGLVTEAAALDALRQRFGRLNRAGRPMAPRGIILASKEDIGAKVDDPIYGTCAAETWKELQALAEPSDMTVDFGVDAFAGRLMPERIAALAAPTKDAPVLLPAYADLWSHTSPIPNADPEVALFLHGPERAPAGVQLVWRADIDERDLILTERERLIDLFKLMPPRAAEAIEIPLWAARAWLREGYEPLEDFSDTTERMPDRDNRVRGRAAFRYAGADSTATSIIFADIICPGDLLVVPAEYGGCDEWGWNPGSREPVKDIAEDAAWAYRARRFAVRITPELIRQHATPEEGADADRAAANLPGVLARYAEDGRAAVLDAVLDLKLPESLRAQLERLQHRKGRLECRLAYGYDDGEQPRGVVLVAPFGLKGGEADDAAAPATESDDLGATPGYAQSLDEHSGEVREWAASFAQRAGLPPAVAADVALAAYLHDAGKLDPRFQAYLSGGDPLGWDGQKVLAKSGKPSLPRAAWDRAELPQNWRHEALSVRLAPLHKDFAKAHDPLLVLWLIGVHHGFGRPFFPHKDPLDEKPRRGMPRVLEIERPLDPGPGPQSLAFDFAGRDWPQIFEELKRCYGIWGLARLEAFVRLADHRASEAAERRYAETHSEEISR